MMIRSRTTQLIDIEDNLFSQRPWTYRLRNQIWWGGAGCFRNNNSLVLGQEVKGPCPIFVVYTYPYSMAVVLQQGPSGRSSRDGLLDAPRVATDMMVWELECGVWDEGPEGGH